MTFRHLGLVLLGLPLLGCGTEGPNRLTIRGAITHAGEPVAFGQIRFDPDGTRGHSGPQGVAEIEHGRYQTVPSFGPTPGPHLVRVTGYDRRPDSPDIRPLFIDLPVQVDLEANTSTLDIDLTNGMP